MQRYYYFVFVSKSFWKIFCYIVKTRIPPSVYCCVCVCVTFENTTNAMRKSQDTIISSAAVNAYYVCVKRRWDEKKSKSKIRRTKYYPSAIKKKKKNTNMFERKTRANDDLSPGRFRVRRNQLQSSPLSCHVWFMSIFFLRIIDCYRKSGASYYNPMEISGPRP